MTSGARPSVLLIDEDPDILELMAFAFADEDLDLVLCKNPEEGLHKLTAQHFDCVLLDVHFAHTPESLGFLDALRHLPGTTPPPVLVTSAMTGADVARQVIDLGARKFIPKPFYPTEVLREIRALVA